MANAWAWWLGAGALGVGTMVILRKLDDETPDIPGSYQNKGPTPSGPYVNASGSMTMPDAEGVLGDAVGITVEQLRKVVPELSQAKAETLAPLMTAAMIEAGISTQRQRAAFVAQLALESGGFQWWREFATGKEYEGRVDLGNTQPGDGVKYAGRGPIQLTGRENYRRAGLALGLDLVNNPSMVEQPAVGFRTSAWYWKDRKINEPAEAGDFREVTRRINGGYNDYDKRLAYYNKALPVMTA